MISTNNNMIGRTIVTNPSLYTLFALTYFSNIFCGATLFIHETMQISNPSYFGAI